MKIKLFTIPNLLTLSNLLCGSFATVAVLAYGDLELAFWLVIAAAVFDFFDGFVARLLHCPSPIGVELDSLADMISFGLVPTVVAYTLWDNSLTADYAPWMVIGGSALCFLIVAFSALRLAKFNIDETQHTEFCGLPTPANALFFVALGWLQQHESFGVGGYVLLFVPLMAWLLISPVRMFALKFQGFGWKGNQLRYIFLAVSVVLLAVGGVYAVPVIILLYILTSVVRWLSCRAAGCEKA
ncbi:MAG: CDP-alcohol phosphatidyltransferase family protein [Alistipes sp.]